MKTTIKDLNITNKTVIIRVDYNVPIKDNKIVDDTRIVNSLETVKYALDNNAKVILLSHLGRIKTEEDTKKNSLEIVAKRLSELLNKEVFFIKDLDFNIIREKVNNIGNNEVITIDNINDINLGGSSKDMIENSDEKK